MSDTTDDMEHEHASIEAQIEFDEELQARINDTAELLDNFYKSNSQASSLFDFYEWLKSESTRRF